MYELCIVLLNKQYGGDFLRVQLIMPDDLVAKIDEVSKSLNISRSAYICMSVSQKLQQDNLIDSLPEMLELIRNTQAIQSKISEKTEKKG